jgi:FkbM family methyltransferase
MAFFLLLFRQFSFFTALRILLVESMRRLFDRNAELGYAASGEDRLVASIFAKPGFYVDVGCNHPTNYSNTFMLYKRGWHGINIDANPALIALHRRLKPRDQSVFAAIAKDRKTLTFTEFEGETLMASFDPELVQARVASGLRIRLQTELESKTLTEMLQQLNAPRQFELLSVDVEGLDLEVLQSLDFDRFRPKLILVEILGYRLEQFAEEAIYQLLAQQGYFLSGYTHMNAIFKDSKAAEFVRKHSE